MKEFSLDPKAGERLLAQSLGPIREELARMDPAQRARAAGGVWDGKNITLTCWDKDYTINYPELVAYCDGQEAGTFFQAILLHYLKNATGAPLTGRWVSLRELPDGLFYVQAFQSYTGGRLVRNTDEEGLKKACREVAALVGGSRGDLGDLFYSFPVLPRVLLGLVYWQGAEGFPPRISILFDAASSEYLPTDVLAIVGSFVTGQLLRAAR
ncbi:MAG: DUF3786 domain-containing protein [Limnochordia bacterium]